jgi:hypothetical protein
MKSLLAMVIAVVALGLLYGVCGLFAAIFFGVLSLAVSHWIVLAGIVFCLWFAASFVIRILLE